MGEAICELASALHTSAGEWGELLPFMFAAVQGSATPDRLREQSLLIFARLAHDIVDTLAAHLPMLHGCACPIGRRLRRSIGRSAVLGQCLKAPALPVRMAAMQATVALTCAIESPAQRKDMQA